MSKKFMIFTVLLTFTICFMGTPILAWAATSYNENNVKCVGMNCQVLM